MADESRNTIYIVGAGFTGTTIAAEIRAKRIFGHVVAFLDDDPGKIGTRIDGIPVLGPIEAAARVIKTTPADEAIIAIPSATREQLARIYAILRRAKFARIRIVPRIAQILDGEAHLIQAREIDPEDFLARSPVRVNLRKSLAYVRGKRVLVTGAGGSIGSELCRQLLEGGAERLYLFGHGENSIYEIQRELRLLQEEGVGEKATIVPIIGEIQDREYLHFILSRTQANVVFHTAAHKHVPLMEANPVEAVKNNVFGTKNIVDASRKSGVERFVLISTDKAVEPSSVYGASKLLAEEIVLREGKERPPLPRRPVRQRPGFAGQHPSPLPQADPQGRSGDGDPPRDAPLFHDDPRGLLPGAQGRRRGMRRRSVPPGHGRERLHPGAGRADDPLLRVRAGHRHPHRVHGAAQGARSCSRSCTRTPRRPSRPSRPGS